MKKKTLLFFSFFCLSIIAKSQPGTLDSSFGINGLVATEWSLGVTVDPPGHFLALQSTGKIIGVGYSFNKIGFSNTLDFNVIRFNINGKIDSSFGNYGIAKTPIGSGDDVAYSINIYPDDKILAVGTVQSSTGKDLGMVRYKQNGELDSSFGINGKVIFHSNAYSIYPVCSSIQEDGKIIIGGAITGGDCILARFNINGSTDNNFGTNGIVITDFGSYDNLTSMALQPDGKIIAAANSGLGLVQNIALAKYKLNGTLDSTFGTNGKIITTFGFAKNLTFDVKIQDDNKIVIGGSTGPNNSYYSYFALRRYTENGVIDAAFGSNGTQTIDIGEQSDIVYSLAIQLDGKIIAAGLSDTIGSSITKKFALARFTKSGLLDNSFGNAGVVKTLFPVGNSAGYSVLIQPDNKVIVAGQANIRFSMARYNTDLSTVPIKFVSFHAMIDGNRNKIEWETENHPDDEYFNLEKSKDGISWLNIGKVNCINEYGKVNHYSFYDLVPYQELTYYRLNQFFKDGTNKYSSIVKLKQKSQDALLNLSIYPTFAKENLFVNFYLSTKQKIVFKIFSIEGKEVFSKSLTGNTGINKIKISLPHNLRKKYLYFNLSTNSLQETLRFFVN
jgi:uncharacterized delta-60 repeat protein